VIPEGRGGADFQNPPGQDGQQEQEQQDQEQQ
jgi:hypothetical protein